MKKGVSGKPGRFLLVLLIITTIIFALAIIIVSGQRAKGVEAWEVLTNPVVILTIISTVLSCSILIFFIKKYKAALEAGNKASEQYRASVKVFHLLHQQDYKSLHSVKISDDVDLLIHEFAINLDKTVNETEQRFKQNYGLKDFSELINQCHGYDELSEKAISFICKFTNAGLGAIYIPQSDNDKTLLKYKAGYGASQHREKYNSFEPGEGQIGQCFIDGEAIHLTDLSDYYFRINSGLGSTVPTSVSVIPLKINGHTLAIMELAYYKIPDTYINDFISLIIDPLSQAFFKVFVNENLKSKMNESQAMLINIMNEIPMKIFIKKYNGEFFVVNDAVSRFHKLSAEEMVGKSDFDFYDSADAKEWLITEQAIIDNGQKEEYIHEDNGKILKTSKEPFYIGSIQEWGLLGIQVDITESIRLKSENEKLTNDLRKFKSGRGDS